MDNNLPVSLFQPDVNEMHINNDEIDEEEENADQIRRDIELAQNLDKYLQIEDETVDQFDTSVNESRYECGEQPRYENELCRLRNELILKKNEVETLKNLLRNERKEKDDIRNDCEKKLKIFEAEKQRAIMGKNQTHDLLIESKTELSNLQNYVEDLKQKLDTVENNNSQLMIELQQTKTMLSDLQHQHHNLELDNKYINNSRMDTNIKQLHEKYNAQTEIMQQQIDSLSSKLNDKENEIKHLTLRYKEVERSREALISEKSEIVNQLANKLESQQKQLLSHACLSEENLSLQQKILSLTKQNDELEKRVINWEKRLESQKFDGATKETMTHLENSNERYETQSDAKHTSSVPVQMPDRTGLLKNELQRCLDGQRAYREEIKQLKNELIQKNVELQQLKQAENQALIGINEYKEMQHRLTTRVKNLENELAAFRNGQTCDQETDTKSEIIDKVSLQKELTSVLENCERVKNLYITVCDEKQEILNELRALKNKVENNKQCEKCDESHMEVQKCQKELLLKQTLVDDYFKQTETLKQELRDSQATIDKLKNKLEIQTHHTDLINDLKLKAEQFEQFMKASRDNSPNEKMAHMSNVDAKMMEEMAQNYAVEIKSLETLYQNQVASLKNEMNEIIIHLKVKTNEIESLKTIILKERLKMQEIIAAKGENAKKVLNQQTEILNKCRLELKSYETKMASFIAELNEKTDLINEEKKSIVLLQQHIVETKTSFQKREAGLIEKINNMTQEALHLNEKYKSAKKTAQHYKMYSEEKEKHMLREYDRLKEAYKEAEQKMEKRLNSLLFENEEKCNKKLHDVRMEYLQKLNTLKKDREVYSSTVTS